MNPGSTPDAVGPSATFLARRPAARQLALLAWAALAASAAQAADFYAGLGLGSARVTTETKAKADLFSVGVTYRF